MSVCRAKDAMRFREQSKGSAAWAIIALALFLATPALGQQGSGPIRLTPPATGESQETAPGGQAAPGQGGQALAPGSLTPLAPLPPPAEPVTPGSPRRGIQIESLSKPNLETLGTLEPEAGGFGYDTWQGSHRGIVIGLLRQLPGSIRSPWGQDIARRLLLTNAEAPDSGPEASDAQLLRARIRHLLDFGRLEEAAQIIALLPSHLRESALARRQVELFLLLGRYDEACNGARGRVERPLPASGAPLPQDDADGEPDFWQKALIFCHVRAGEIAAAQLGLQLMQELGGDPEGAFLALGRRMLDGVGPLPERLPPRAPELAMADQLGEALPDGLLPLEVPKIAVAALRLRGLSAAERVRAAESAAAGGALGGEGLRESYRQMEFSQQQVATALSLSGSQPGGLDRALLYQAAEADPQASVRAEILLTAFEDARADRLYVPVLEAFEPLLLSLEPQPELLWFAASAGRGLYALGNFELAGAWFDLARRESMISPQAQASLTAIWPYARLAGFSASDWDGSLVAWAQSRNDPPQRVAELQSLLAAAFEGLGQADMSDLSRQALPYGSGFEPEPSSHTLLALRDASDGGRLGETLLLSLIALGPDGTERLHPRALEAICSALLRVGLHGEARALAIEAALRAGI